MGGGLALGNRALQPQEVGELVFELELADVPRAEHLPEFQEQPLADLLADRDRGPSPSSPDGVDLEHVHIERATERSGERRGHEAAGEFRRTLAQDRGLTLCRAGWRAG